ncbi:8-amino-7-oxononanoate synthase [Flavitalea sp. BT771]|uniref:aminotransferase class I/II-fold pyridoxal phosphate-dependent enzyme n=1 Tax=Flavitalea sp. BT771 TaxID=3063329 RepID=UPI0026E17A16|nr:8-amino-7-oxononanoate synthase [Flavitalea sp. BT771]MDO6430106.1 8-amino-7-oxononanoate synthase [Flavitalea sp. BT771]MDV6219755.1 8-amino-7-oxononanoate synthase [Flavitalea sp. BT771]
MNEDFLDKKLQERKDQHAFRRLRLPDGATDLCSNDYLGIATNRLIEKALAAQPNPAGANSQPGAPHGSGGSRLLAGNYPLIEETERELATFHAAEAGLIFNSGYDANLGLLSCLPQRGDTILYDQLSHASIRDGIRLSFARAFSFGHNDLQDLEQRLQAARQGGTLFVVTESVFSMDGHLAPLAEMADLCQRHDAHLIVDEAHATGIIGQKGEGLVQHLHLQKACFARVHTFGKAVGCHGAVILGSHRLRDYLINFSRPFIYTTALPPSAILAIQEAYSLFPDMQQERLHLQTIISRLQGATLPFEKLNSSTPIQGIITPGNEAARSMATALQDEGLDVRPILYPSVPRGGERLRIVLHAFNTVAEVDQLIAVLQNATKT